jgi:RND family efflux transporter MFP subunit
MHPSYKSDRPGIAPDCGMKLVPVYAQAAASSASQPTPLPAGVVAIDAARQQLFGIQVAPVEQTSGVRTVRLLGRVAADETRVYRLNVGVDGFVKSTADDAVGNHVRKNQKLAIVYSPEFLTVVGGYLSATERSQNNSTAQNLAGQQGWAGVQNWADRLRNLGMSDFQIDEVTHLRRIPEDIYVISPVDGFIISRNIAASERFERHTEFYRIADLRHVWILADIFGSEAQYFRPGAVARVTLPDQGRTLTARVSEVLPEVDPSTRTLKLRLEADNPGFALRPDMFVDVGLPERLPPGLTVPVDAVIDSGLEHRVYVERSSGVFEPRQVETGWRVGGRVQIVRGLAEGERVVTNGTFLVDSESRLYEPAAQTIQRQPEPTAPRDSHQASLSRPVEE